MNPSSFILSQIIGIFKQYSVKGVKNMFEYQMVETVTVTQVVHLYEAVGWMNYTQNLKMLETALTASSYLLLAYHNDTIVGILRVVGDWASIMYIQDLIVLPEYQRRGIGRSLLQQFLEAHRHVYQIILSTDMEDKTVAFYRALGFVPSGDFGVTSMMYQP